jgi:hypothetical protein
MKLLCAIFRHGFETFHTEYSVLEQVVGNLGTPCNTAKSQIQRYSVFRISYNVYIVRYDWTPGLSYKTAYFCRERGVRLGFGPWYLLGIIPKSLY